jgi:cyclohexanone monooxygenase
MDDAWREELKRSVADRRTAAANTYFGISLEESARMTADATPEEREREYQRRWDEGGLNMLLSFADVMIDEQANREVAEFIKRKVRETVKDPVVAEKLVPGDHPVGTKRICVGTDYYEAYNRDNVTLHDARDEAIVGFTPTGIRTAAGHVDLDPRSPGSPGLRLGARGPAAAVGTAAAVHTLPPGCVVGVPCSGVVYHPAYSGTTVVYTPY